MKNNDLLLYGGLAVLAYLFLSKNSGSASPGVTQVAPVTSVLPAANAANSNLSNTLVSALSALAPQAVKLLTPSASAPAATTAAATQAAQVAQQDQSLAQQYFAQPSIGPVNTATSYLTAPVPSYVAPTSDQTFAQLATPDNISNDSLEYEFMNGDYPGAISGVRRDYIAHCMGQY